MGHDHRLWGTKLFRKLSRFVAFQKLFFLCKLELGALCIVIARLCGRGYGAEKRNCTETRDSAGGSTVRTVFFFCQRSFIFVRLLRPGLIPRAVVGFVVDGVALWTPPPEYFVFPMSVFIPQVFHANLLYW